MEKTQTEVNDSQGIKNAENSLFKWVIGVMVTILFALISVIYGYLKSADASVERKVNTAEDDIETLKEEKLDSDRRFQNLESNVYILCKAQKLDCIPPIK